MSTQPTYSGGMPDPRHDRQHPDFTDGNLVAVRHGAFSERLVRPRALEIAAGLQAAEELPDYLLSPKYRGALLDLCLALARRERLEAWLEETAVDGIPPELSPDGQVRAAADLLLKVERAVDRHRDRLGLSPLAAARLGRDVAAAQVSAARVLSGLEDDDVDDVSDDGGSEA